MGLQQQGPQLQPIVVGIGLRFQSPLMGRGPGIERFLEVASRRRGERPAQPQHLRLLPEPAATAATLSHMNGFVVQHLHEGPAPLGRQIGANAQHAGLGIPFARCTLQPRGPEHQMHPSAAQGLQQHANRSTLLVKTWGLAQQLLHLLEGERRIAGAVFVDVARAHSGDPFHPGAPAGIGCSELGQQFRLSGW